MSVHKDHTLVWACADTLHGRADEFSKDKYSQTGNAYPERGLPDPTFMPTNLGIER
jgi:hypothetical protein